MGKVTNQTTAAPSPPPPIKHFSHPHHLHPIPNQNIPQNPTPLCSACKLQSSNGVIIYTCPPCNFFLHQSCAQLPQLITHPAHGGCNLSLLTISSYAGGMFSCDACSRRGDGWSYHCSRCDYDLHIPCSIKPLKIRNRAHPCDLNLTFRNPYADSNGFSCDVCRRIEGKQWLYRCDSCQFDVHMDCIASQPPQILQHQYSMPRSNPSHQHIQLMHSASTGGIPSQHGFNQFQSPVYQGGFNGFAPSNRPLMQNNQPPRMGGGFGSNLLTAAIGGVVEGVMQQVGQAAVQEVISAGEGGGGDAGAFSGDGSSY